MTTRTGRSNKVVPGLDPNGTSFAPYFLSRTRSDPNLATLIPSPSISRSNSADNIPNIISVEPVPTSIPALQTDDLSFSEQHAKPLLDWQYLSAYLGLGAFGRRALTTALLIGGVGAALSGIGLAGVLIGTAVLLAIDISYISLYGHKDRHSIERSECKLHQLQIEQWIKDHKHGQQNSETFKRRETLISAYKAAKEYDRLAVQDINKCKKLKTSQIIDESELAGMAKRQCPSLHIAGLPAAKVLALIEQQANVNVQSSVKQLAALEKQLSHEAALLKVERLRRSPREIVAEIIKNQSAILFAPYLQKIDQENKNRDQAYVILTQDPLIRRMMLECKINAKSLAEEYKNSTQALSTLLFKHYDDRSALYDKEHKKAHELNRKLTFGQFAKVGFRGLSLSLVLAFVLHGVGVCTFTSGTFLMIGLLGGLAGLILGFGNSFAQRNKDNLNQKYSEDADLYKEKDRREKFICLAQILSAKLHYMPTQGLRDVTKPSEAVAVLKRDMLFKLIPIALLLGSLARRPLTLLKLIPYSHLFKSLFPVTIILVSMVIFFIYDIGLSTTYIHRQRHSLDIHELQNPELASDGSLHSINDILDKKIDSKLALLLKIKQESRNFVEIVSTQMKGALTQIIGNPKVSEEIIKQLCEHENNIPELKNLLLRAFGTDPKLPEQYRDHFETREDCLEKLEDMQVMKPTFRGMSIGGSFPNLFTHANLSAITVGSVLSGLGLASLFPIPVPVGLAAGLVIGLTMGIWMKRIDDRQVTLQKQNLLEPDAYHQTDIRRKLNDALEAILLNDFSPNLSSTATYTPFAQLTRRSSPTSEYDQTSSLQAEPTNHFLHAGGDFA